MENTSKGIPVIDQEKTNNVKATKLRQNLLINDPDVYGSLTNIKIQHKFLKRLVGPQYTPSSLIVTLVLISLTSPKNPTVETTYRDIARLTGKIAENTSINESYIPQILDRLQGMGLIKYAVYRSDKTKRAQRVFIDILGNVEIDKVLDNMGLNDASENNYVAEKGGYRYIPEIIVKKEFFELEKPSQLAVLYVTLYGYHFYKDVKRRVYRDTIAARCSKGELDKNGKLIGYKNLNRLDKAIQEAAAYMGITINKVTMPRNNRIAYEIILDGFVAASNNKKVCNEKVVPKRDTITWEYIKLSFKRLCKYTLDEKDQHSWIALYGEIDSSVNFISILWSIGVGARDVQTMKAYFRKVGKSLGYIKAYKKEAA